MKKYNVWMEGFMVQGMDSPQRADYLGMYKGKTFQEACEKAVDEKLKQKDTYYDPEDNTYYGCRFFKTETEARKSFG